MAITVYRAGELHNQPARPGRPAKRGKPARPGRPPKRGKFGVSKSHFYDEIEPRLEKVRLGPKPVGYTDRSVDKVIEEGIVAVLRRYPRTPSAPLSSRK